MSYTITPSPNPLYDPNLTGNFNLTYTSSTTIDTSKTYNLKNASGTTLQSQTPISTYVSGVSLSNPLGMAIDSLGNLYVCNSVAGNVIKYASSDQTMTTIITGLNNPTEITIDSSDVLYVVITGTVLRVGTVRKYTTAGLLITSYFPTNLYNPHGLAIDLSGNVYISDDSSNAVGKFTSNGNTINLTYIPKASILAYGDTPYGLTFNSDCTYLYIGLNGSGDGNGTNILRYKMSDSTLSVFVELLPGTNLPADYAVPTPADLNFDLNGNLYVTDNANNAIYKIDSSATVSTYITSDNNSQGVIIDTSNNLYYSSYTDNNIYKVSLYKVYFTDVPDSSLQLGSNALTIYDDMSPTPNLLLSAINLDIYGYSQSTCTVITNPTTLYDPLQTGNFTVTYVNTTILNTGYTYSLYVGDNISGYLLASNITASGTNTDTILFSSLADNLTGLNIGSNSLYIYDSAGHRIVRNVKLNIYAYVSGSAAFTPDAFYAPTTSTTFSVTYTNGSILSNDYTYTLKDSLGTILQSGISPSGGAPNNELTFNPITYSTTSMSIYDSANHKVGDITLPIYTYSNVSVTTSPGAVCSASSSSRFSLTYTNATILYPNYTYYLMKTGNSNILTPLKTTTTSLNSTTLVFSSINPAITNNVLSVGSNSLYIIDSGGHTVSTFSFTIYNYSQSSFTVTTTSDPEPFFGFGSFTITYVNTTTLSSNINYNLYQSTSGTPNTLLASTTISGVNNDTIKFLNITSGAVSNGLNLLRITDGTNVIVNTFNFYHYYYQVSSSPVPYFSPSTFYDSSLTGSFGFSYINRYSLTNVGYTYSLQKSGTYGTNVLQSGISPSNATIAFTSVPDTTLSLGSNALSVYDNKGTKIYDVTLKIYGYNETSTAISPTTFIDPNKSKTFNLTYINTSILNVANNYYLKNSSNTTIGTVSANAGLTYTLAFTNIPDTSLSFGSNTLSIVDSDSNTIKSAITLVINGYSKSSQSYTPDPLYDPTLTGTFSLTYTDNYILDTSLLYRLTKSDGTTVLKSSVTPTDTHNITFSNVSDSNLIIGSNTLYIYDSNNVQVSNNILLNISCYLEGTKILCLVDGKEVYLPIENLRNGFLVKTYLHDYKKIVAIGKGYMRNDSNCWYKSMYKMTKTDDMLDDLFITGYHSILENELSENELSKHIELNIFDGNFNKVDDKFLVPASISDKCVQLKDTNIYTYYHFALESPDEYQQFGVYANGALSESTSIYNYNYQNYIDLQ